jgi:hypothetical protein
LCACFGTFITAGGRSLRHGIALLPFWTGICGFPQIKVSACIFVTAHPPEACLSWRLGVFLAASRFDVTGEQIFPYALGTGIAAIKELAVIRIIALYGAFAGIVADIG